MVLNQKVKQTVEEQNQALREELQALREDKATTEAKNDELRLIHLRQENRITQLRKDIDDFITDNQTLRDDYDEVAGINRTLRSNLADLNNNVDQWEKYALAESDQLAKLNAYTDGLEQRLQRSKARTKHLKERNEDLEDLLVTGKLESQAIEAECKDLERRNKALWKTVNYLDGLSEEDQVEVMRMRRGVLELRKLWEAGELD
jgi:chromosome segregation ATPase